MTFSTETLMAYADGELDADTHAAVDAAMAEDPEVAAAVTAQINERDALQAKLHAAFDGALTEPIPARLTEATQADPSVIAIANARTARRTELSRRWSLPQWGAIAATLLLGVVAGRVAFNREPELILAEQGRMTAHGDLSEALSQQTGGAVDRATGIKVGVSYLAKSGEYCRTFTVSKQHVLAGLACQRDAQWTIDALTRANGGSTGAYRMAGVEVPALILGIVENTISGEPLDAEQEAEARARSWKRQ